MINSILANDIIFLALCLLVINFIIVEYSRQKARQQKVNSGELFVFSLSRSSGVYYLLLVAGIVLVLWRLIDFATPSTVMVVKNKGLDRLLGELMSEKTSVQPVTKLRAVLLVILGFYGILRSFLFWGVVHWEADEYEIRVYRNHQLAFTLDTQTAWQISLLDEVIVVEDPESERAYSISDVKNSAPKQEAFLAWLATKGIT
ncbi:MAG: hypothetical protein AAGH79_12890 [Bacteroidota bacterium]